MSVMRIKRGTTDEWKLGPQLVDFSECTVNGKDSTIYCEGTTLKMNVFTTSAENFSSLDSQISASSGLEYNKHYGLQVFYQTDLTKVSSMSSYAHALRIKVVDKALPNGCTIRVCWNGSTQITVNNATGLQTKTAEIPVGASNFGIVVLWDNTKATPEEITFELSICKKNVYDTLMPGQLGGEYYQTTSTGDAVTFLKVGAPSKITPNTVIDDDSAVSWDSQLYVGQVLPGVMYGNSLPPSSGHYVMGQVFYKKA